MKHYFDSDNYAFTLIELSIVLIIIGLIVGAVLVGKDLIKAAEIRNTISQIEKYTTAVQTFRVKYNCLPGDCKNAEELGLGSSSNPGANGDGDGQIRSYTHEFDQWWQQFEKTNLWYHLMRAGLIPDQMRGYDVSTAPAAVSGMVGHHPAPKIGMPGQDSGTNYLPAIVPFSSNSQNGFALVNIAGTTAPTSYTYTLTALDAYAIDSKIDDGLPLTGSIRITQPYSGIAFGNAWGCQQFSPSGVYDLRGQWNAYTNTWDAQTDASRVECGLAFLNRF